ARGPRAGGRRVAVAVELDPLVAGERGGERETAEGDGRARPPPASMIAARGPRRRGGLRGRARRVHGRRVPEVRTTRQARTPRAVAILAAHVERPPARAHLPRAQRPPPRALRRLARLPRLGDPAQPLSPLRGGRAPRAPAPGRGCPSGQADPRRPLRRRDPAVAPGPRAPELAPLSCPRARGLEGERPPPLVAAGQPVERQPPPDRGLRDRGPDRRRRRGRRALPLFAAPPRPRAPRRPRGRGLGRARARRGRPPRRPRVDRLARGLEVRRAGLPLLQP